MTILFYLTMTWCPVHLPKADASCMSDSRWCALEVCADLIKEKRPGQRLRAWMAVEERT